MADEPRAAHRPAPGALVGQFTGDSGGSLSPAAEPMLGKVATMGCGGRALVPEIDGLKVDW